MSWFEVLFAKLRVKDKCQKSNIKHLESLIDSNTLSVRKPIFSIMNPNEYLARVFISAEKAFEIALNPYFQKVDWYFE